jgi:hypothetical protein
MKTIYLIIIGVVVLVAGFFIGRSTTTSSITTKYVKGETVANSVNVPVPYNVFIPAVPLLPTKPDTINNYIVLKVDTAKIIANYILRKRYTTPLFDDSNGKLTVMSVVQYNSLDSLGYSFTPIIKETTITRTKTFTPFVNASYNSFGYYGAGGGIYINNIGVGVKYITNFSQQGYEVNAGIKF